MSSYITAFFQKWKQLFDDDFEGWAIEMFAHQVYWRI